MEMWGDAEGAYSIKKSDSLSTSLFQITGPEHIPYNDSRWQKLLLHYEQLVHLHNLGLASPSLSAEGDVVGNACRQCAKYSPTSSNLAAFSLHVVRMIRDLQSSLETYSTESKGENVVAGGSSSKNRSQKQPNGSAGKSALKQRISLIGKARVTCGSINLLRILSHETIAQACFTKSESAAEGYDTNYVLKESFTYRLRGELDGNDNGQDAAMEIVASIMSFLSSIGCNIHEGRDSAILAIPEMHDVIVQIFSLLLVLLSTQLYQPMVSSAELTIEGRPGSNFFLEKWMEYSHWQRSQQQQKSKEEHMRQEQAQSLGQESVVGEPDNPHNEPLLFLHVCLHWLVSRPSPPRRSIASHYCELPKSIAKQMTNMAVAPDGMYESHSIVMASVPHGENKVSSKAIPPTRVSLKSPDSGKGALPGTDSSTPETAAIALGTDDTIDLSSAGHVSGEATSWNGPSDLLSHPLRSLLLLSSSFFLLPIRLVRLAFNLLGHSQYHAIAGGSPHSSDGDKLILQQLQAHCEKKTGWNKTNNILWLTDSPIADLGSALMLILSNNCRSKGNNEGSAGQNPFRAELASLNDNRWDSGMTESQSTTGNSLFPSPQSNFEHKSILSINFESLFGAFGGIAHTEVGALLLYTLLLSSPTFAESISARSDLDTLVMPLLRSLYFSTTAHTGLTSKPKSGQLSQLITLTPNNRPFRSQSQLYVILILLLIFSQDPSFGRDSFRRVRVSISAVKWYKERLIKEASLGSMILLVLLRATTFNLNRLQDEFLLSNCCAVLLNLSPHVVDLHDYVASRLVSVTTSCFKRYVTLVAENGGEPEEGDMSTFLGMHGEACRTFLQLVRHSIRPKCLEKNIHLVYALLLEQRDFQKMGQSPSLGDMSTISALIDQANVIIQEKGDGLSATQTLEVLIEHIKELKAYTAPDGLVSDADSVASDMSDLGNLTFTYEEEVDPEVFFVPYIWDVIVGTLTTTTIEWSRNKIQVFPLNEDTEGKTLPQGSSEALTSSVTDVHDNTPDVV